MSGNSLVKLERARAEIAAAKTVESVKAIGDKAEAAAHYAKKAKLGLAIEDDCNEIVIHAHRRAGELLDEMGLQPGARSDKILIGSNEVPIPTLADLGIEKKESARWQKMAAIPEDIVERVIVTLRAEEKPVRESAVIRKASEILNGDTQTGIKCAPPEGKYRCIVIDPPWKVAKIDRSEQRPAQGWMLDYPMMELDQIASLNVGDLAATDGCHLYLWSTQKYLPDALKLAEGWGFMYQCLLTWVKPSGMTPFSWMYNTEHVIFARKGSLKLQKLGIKLSFEAPVIGHSVKPDKFYEIVTKASQGPRLDMFARQKRKGFKAWGNEIAISKETVAG